MSNFNNTLAGLDEIRMGFMVLQELLALVPPHFEVNANNLGHLMAALNKQLQQCCLELEQFAPGSVVPVTESQE